MAAKVTPVTDTDDVAFRTFEGPYKKPIPCAPEPLTAPDPHYLARKKEVGEKFFTCKSERKFCYFTDGAKGKDLASDEVSIVLCLHSCGLNKWMFLQQVPFENIFQISVDRMGHGGSSDPPTDTGGPEDYPFADLVQEMNELVDGVYAELQIPSTKKLFVVGHSMGACSAINMAAAQGEFMAKEGSAGGKNERIAAIAPVSGPSDIFNPAVTKKERAFMMGFFRNAEVKNCCPGSCLFKGGGGSFGRWLIHKFGEGALRPVKGAGAAGDPNLAALFTDYCRSHEGGDKRAWDVVYTDPFIVTQILDAHVPGPHSAKVWTTEMRRGNSAPWSYDEREVKVPCFVYMGDKEECPFQCGKIHEKLIPGCEFTPWEAYGHASIFCEHRRIIQALVKGKKVEGDPLWKLGEEALKEAQKKQ